MKAPDLLRRFTPTPLSADFCLMGRSVHLETNSPSILEQVKRALVGYGQALAGRADFLWRLVDETADSWGPALPQTTVNVDEHLLFINLDRRGFIAVDRKEQEAVGFVDARWGPAFFSGLLWVVMAFAFGLTTAQHPPSLPGGGEQSTSGGQSC